MRVPRFVRRLAVAGAVVVGLVLLAAVVVPALVSGDDLRERVLAQAEAATGASIDLQEARLTVLPRLGVRLRTGSVAGTGESLRAARGQDWGIASYRAEITEAEVRVALLPLVSRRLEVQEIRLAGPRLELVRDGERTVAEDYRLVVRDLVVGVADAPAPAPGAPPGEAIPEDLSCRAELTVGALAAGDFACADLAAEAELDGRLLEVPHVEAKLGDGQLTGSASVDWVRDPWGELVFAYEAADVPAPALLGGLVPDLARRLEGRLDAAGSGSCRLQDKDAVLASLDLTGNAHAGDGVLRAGDWLEGITPYLGRRQDLKDIRFTSLDHAYRVENGRWVINDLVIDGADTAWRGSGSVGLDGSLDLALQVKLPRGFTPELGQWSFLAETLRDEDGRVQLDLVLGGRADAPAVGLDLTRLKAGATDQGADAVKKGVGRLLDKWKSK